jgi:MFS family permease
MRGTRNRALVLGTLCLAAFLISVDTTIVNVALPTLVRRLHATTSDLQWIVDAYSLAFAALILAAGSFSDRVGRKGTRLAGLGVFAVASAAGALCEGAGQLIAARAVMGIGAALIFPSTLSLLANVFTGRAERARSACGARPPGSASQRDRSPVAGCSTTSGGAACSFSSRRSRS